MTPTTSRDYAELCASADRRAMRVLLRLDGLGAKSRLCRLALADRDGEEIAAARIGTKDGALGRASRALLEYLEELDRREAA